MLQVHQLHKRYGDKIALHELSLEVGPGQIVGLLGPNGAGKTTTVSIILGLLTPTSGTVHIDGLDLAKRRSEALSRSNFAAVYAPLPGNLTVEQNLRVFACFYGVKRSRVEEVLEQFDLREFRKTRTGVLSSGEQTRVGLAKAMLNRPKLLLLDEPTASLDPSAARYTREHILAYAKAGSAVLWTSHNMQEVEDVCERVLFLSQGKVLLDGDPRTLPQQHGHPDLEELFVSLARE